MRDLYRRTGRRQIEVRFEGTGADAVLGEHGVGSADAHQVVGAEGSPHR